MDTDTKKKVWRIIGYSAFVCGAFCFFLYQTFPYALIVQRATNGLQRRARMRIQIDRVSPYWFSGIEAQGLNIRQVVKKGTAEIQIDALTFRLSLLSLLTGSINANFSSKLARGELKGSFTRKSKQNEVKLLIDSINLAALGPTATAIRSDKQAKPLLAMLFAPVYGRLSGDIELSLPEYGAAASKPPTPRKTKPKPKPKTRRTRTRTRTRTRSRTNTKRSPRRTTGRGIDIERAEGDIKINIRGFSMGPGYFPAGQMGEVPVPLLRLGNLLLKLKLSKGRLTIVKGVSVGDDAEIYLTGYIQLRPRLDYSIFRGKVKFKINKSFMNRPSTPSLLKTAFQMLGPASQGFYTFKIYMPFRGRPNFQRL